MAQRGCGFYIWSNLIAGLVLSTILLAIVDPRFAAHGVPLVLVCIGLIVALMLAPPVVKISLRSGLLRGPWLQRLGEKVKAGLGASSRTLSDARFWRHYPVLTIASFATSLAMTWTCFVALDSDIALSGVVFLFVVTSLLS